MFFLRRKNRGILWISKPPLEINSSPNDTLTHTSNMPSPKYVYRLEKLSPKPEFTMHTHNQGTPQLNIHTHENSSLAHIIYFTRINSTCIRTTRAKERQQKTDRGRAGKPPNGLIQFSQTARYRTLHSNYPFFILLLLPRHRAHPPLYRGTYANLPPRRV